MNSKYEIKNKKIFKMNKNHKNKKQFTFTGNMKVELFTVHRQNTE